MIFSDRDMIFQRFIVPFINSNMYLAIDDGVAFIVDPFVSSEALFLIVKANVHKIYIVLTHEHADHISGIGYFAKQVEYVRVIAHQACAASVSDKKKNRPIVLLGFINKENEADIKRLYAEWPVESTSVDIVIDKDCDMEICKHKFRFIHAPGHSPGSMLIIVDDEYLFSGDYMIADVPVILRYPGGSENDYYEYTLPILKKLSGNLSVLPGHGETYLLSDFVYCCGRFTRKENV